MKYVRFCTPDGQRKYGVLTGDTVHECEGDYFSTIEYSGKHYLFDEIRLLAPSCPSKIVAVGLNDTDHIREMGFPMPEEPVIFLKPPSAVLKPEGFIEIPEGEEQVDYEAEFAMVIRKTCRKISKEDAKAYILGYTCLNDVTVRRVQALDGQWTRAKGYDTFAPFGPYIEDSLNPHETDMKLRLNGDIKQHSNTRKFRFPAEELLSFVSHVMTLFPGDVITMGTSSGIGPMVSGDTVEVVLNDEMILRNKVRNGVMRK